MKIYLRISILTLLSIGSLSCKKNNNEDSGPLKQLHRMYKNGEISECTLDGNKVFTGGLNAYDAGSDIFDQDGHKIGSCNYAWGPTDSICGKLKDCETIYRVKDNISGQAPVDKYNLAN